MTSAAAVWVTPTRTRTLSPRAACSASAATASTSRSARRARRQTASPAGVRRTGARPPGRWNSVCPRAASSAETWCDRADCVKPSAAAAARNDPTSATASTAWSSRSPSPFLIGCIDRNRDILSL